MLKLILNPFATAEMENLKSTDKLDLKIEFLHFIVIKCMDNESLATLTALYNRILSCGHFPPTWSKGIIVPIHKNGSVEDVNNYRGITLLPVIAKLFTALLESRIQEWAEESGIIPDCQFGFRGSHRATDAVFVLCGFVDFRKAFDSIDLGLLWNKLWKLGISTKVLTVLQSMYQTAQSAVRTSCGYSYQIVCNIGVRQGCPLSPNLFSLFVSDLMDRMRDKTGGVSLNRLSVHGLMFADDVVLVAETQEKLQAMLDELSMYCSDWKLEVNTENTKIVVAFGSSNRQLLQFLYRGKTIEITDHFRYLGFTLSHNRGVAQGVNTLSQSGLKALRAIANKVHQLGGLDLDIQVKLFDTLVLPILTYGCEIWGSRKFDCLEKVLLKFCKGLLGVPLSATTAAVLGELRRFPIWMTTQLRVINYWI